MRAMIMALVVSTLRADEAPPEEGLQLAESLSPDHPECSSENGCIHCPGNTYYWGTYTGRHYCVHCPAGFESPGCLDCKPDPYNDSCRKIETCPKGKFAGTNNRKCEECAEGTWQSEAGQSSCLKCPAGLFQPKKGAHSCYNCPVGTYGPVEGSSSCLKCASCKEGKYGTTTGDRSTSASACSCLDCAPGTFSPAGYTTCFSCPAGRFQLQSAASSCQDCPNGKYQSEAKATACRTCEANTYTSKPGLATCDKYFADYTVHFRVYDYTYANHLKAQGWHLMTYQDIALYKNLFQASYTQSGGVQALGQWQGAGCCLALAEGYRLTVDHDSYVYPMSNSGSIACSQNESSHFQDNKYHLAFHTHGNFSDIETARSLSGAKGVGMCKSVENENNPGIFMAKVKGVSSIDSCAIVHNERFCLAPHTNHIATSAPSASPSQHEHVVVSPEDCIVSEFGAWSACSNSCGNGTQHRIRKILSPPLNGGKPCPQKQEEWQICLNSACQTPSPTAHANVEVVVTVPPTPAPVVPTYSPTKVPGCVVSAFSDWSACSRSCGTGFSSRSRTITASGGHCPALHHFKACNVQACPINCQVTRFSEWQPCSVSCGSGMQHRSRGVARAPAFGGTVCGAVNETQTCNSQKCPVDCSMKYMHWSPCSVSCGSGKQERQRVIVTPPSNGGTVCDAEHTESMPCNAGTCPVHCQVSPFSAWSGCSKSCGSGSQYRNRTVIIHAQHGGFVCPDLSQLRLCNEDNCPVDCVMSQFGEYTACSQTCGTGFKLRSRSPLTSPPYAFGGKPCLHATETTECNTQFCPMDCHVTEFAKWESCSRSCGSGMHIRRRSIAREVLHGGVPCPSLTETGQCETQVCPTDCAVSVYSGWSICTKSCKDISPGSQTRTRSVTVDVAFGGKSCPVLHEIRKCSTNPCPVDCVMIDGPWGSCSKTCGGYMRRVKVLHRPSYYGGKPCDQSVDTQACGGECPEDCQLSSYGPFSACTHTCGGGQKTRSRTIIKAAQHFGGCPSLEETRSCAEQHCPIDCVMTPWSSWTDCSVECGVGTRQQTRIPLSQPQFSGEKCSAFDTKQESCDAGPCPVHCEVSEFGPWADCSQTCGGGNQTRTRHVSTHAAHGGYTCPDLSESITCNMQPCPEDCEVSEFSEWSLCDISCGAGTQTRTRTVTRETKHGGKCPGLHQQRTCNMFACPQDCVYFARAASTAINFYLPKWSRCTKSCGSGSQTRMLSRMRAAQYGGHACPSYEESRVCNAQPCPTDCLVSAFGGFTDCDAPCNGGFKIRGRSIARAPSDGGKKCPSLSEMKTCNTQRCIVDCEVTKFTAWSPCSTSCGGGYQTRSRTVTRMNEYGGIPCPSLQASQHCKDAICPVDCEVTSYANWSPCAVSCGGGTEVWRRTIRRPAGYGGKACPTLETTRSCSNSPCPVDCVLSASSPWSSCTQSCDGGSRSRTRSIVRQAQQGGKACPEQLTVTAPCGEDPCSYFLRCTMSTWTQYSPCSHACGHSVRVRRRHVVKQHSRHAKCPTVVQVESCDVAPCQVDCRLSEFTAFGFCSRSCGTGQTNRYRSVERYPANGGQACGVLNETKACNTHPCAADCTVSQYSAWSVCTKSCGGGSQTRTRSVNQATFGGGQPCPVLNQTSLCGQVECPIDCILNTWQPWGSCTMSCGGGRQLRIRRVVRHPVFGGKRCAVPHQLRECGTISCPIDCAVGEFGAWSTCSQTCGTGFQLRSRIITSDNAFGGRVCPDLIQTQKCHHAPCQLDCVVSEFSQWTACSSSCGFGLSRQMRVILAPAQHGGADCPALSNERDCNEGPCPVHCEVSDWEVPLSTCSRSCGTGTVTYRRTVLFHAKHGGYTCPSLEVERPCKIHPCPVDCVMSDYSPWQACTSTCGVGYQLRTRSLHIGPKFGGKNCGSLSQSRRCPFVPCPIDCIVSGFGDWSDCSTSCGSGVRSRARAALKDSLWGGKACPTLTEETTCNTHSCPADCVVGEFSNWSVCSATCGQGHQSRTRSIDRFVAFGGQPCPVLVESVSCNQEECPADCTTTEFTEWNLCSASCGTGVQMRYRSIAQEAMYGGMSCPELVQAQNCEESPCPIDCVVTEYSTWSDCSVSCAGQGIHIRTRSVEVSPSYGGRTCPNLEQEESCNNGPCPENCEVTKWSAWTMCTASCGGGVHSRNRTIESHAVFAGYSCPHLTEEEPCQTQPCATDCIVTSYGLWSACSRSCGVGTQSRERTIQTPMEAGGRSCPAALTQQRTCNSQACPIDCQIAAWSAWGDCSLTCGNGYRSRTTSVQRSSSYGGYACPVLFQHEACNTNPCPVDCKVSGFAPWNSCSATCGTGRQTKERRVVHAAQFGGSECPALTAEQNCADQACPTDCSMTAYGSFGSCTHSCGTGSRTRSRSIAQAAANGGLPCAQLTHVELCSQEPCPVDCQVSLFSTWTACTVTCGSGITRRTRQVTQEALHKGMGCPALLQLQACNVFDCPVHCQVTAFGLWSRCTKICGSGLQHRSRAIVAHSSHGGYTCPALAETRVCNDYDCTKSALSVVRATGVFDAPNNYVKGLGTSESLAASYKGHLLDELSQYNVSISGEALNVQVIREPEFTVSFEVQVYLAEENAPVTAEHSHLLGKAVAAMMMVGESAVRCNLIADSRRLLGSESVATFQLAVEAQELTSAHTIYGVVHGDQFESNLQQQLSLDGWSTASIVVVGVMLSTEPVRCSITVTLTNPSFANTIKIAFALLTDSSNQSADFVNHNIVGLTVDTTISQNCVVAGWSAWGVCSVSCGSGHRKRTRATSTEPSDGGESCPALEESMSCNTESCPIDCAVTAFGNWSVCSRHCGTGYHRRSRSISRSATFGGIMCPELVQREQCNTHDCPTDCVVSDFSPPLACSKTCGSGTQQSFRSVKVKAANGGQSCPSLENVTLCNEQPCPQDCSVTPWESWLDCSVSCGGEGNTSRTRTVVRNAAWGGVRCPATLSSKACNNGPCTPDCNVSAWSTWSTCTNTCGGGMHTRSRTIEHRVNPNSMCPFLVDTQQCNVEPCPVDCQVELLQDWSDCPRTCGGNYERRTWAVSVSPMFGGKGCPATEESRQCGTVDCPVDCVVSDFGEWSFCSTSCGLGYRSRGRSVLRPTNGGQTCPTLTETTSCNLLSCPRDCNVTVWSSWGLCSAVCGGGSHTRHRTVTTPAQFGGMQCPPLQQSEICNNHACPRNCTVSAYGPWSECSKTCNAGVRIRTRSVVSHAENGGYVCPELADSSQCNTELCPSNCAVSTWSAFGPCSVTCGDHGVKVRTRRITLNSTLGGRACPSLEDSTSCISVECPRHCAVSDFGPWLRCSKSCGGGSQVRSRVILTHASSGFVCPSLTESQSCNTHSCPTDCVLSNFSSWAACSVSCGSGHQSRHRGVVQAANGGQGCSHTSETRWCNTQFCPVDCRVTAFGKWTACSGSCGSSYRLRLRSVEINAVSGGIACPSLTEQVMCNMTEPCPRDCIVSPWTEWTPCSVTCGGTGSHSRTRVVETNSLHGGQMCPVLYTTTTCNNGPCPIHCEVSEFGPWDACSKTCGSGIKSRSRTVTTHSVHGGYNCPELIETIPCNGHSCPGDCHMSAFSEWSSCSRSCGTGSAVRHRSIVANATDGGRSCGSLTESMTCSTQFCPMDCVVSLFGNWSSCSKSCGTGFKARSRTVAAQNMFGGQPCPVLEEVERCAQTECPVDCAVSEFAALGPCSTSCGGGTRTLSRHVRLANAYGGQACPSLVQLEACNQHPCPTDCQMSDWTDWTECSLSCGSEGIRTRSRKVAIAASHGGFACTNLTNLQNMACDNGPCSQNCLVGPWSTWDTCGKSCGSGTQQRNRVIAAHGNNGYTCPSLLQTRSCNSQACPTDCAMSQYTDWTFCTASCGTGTQIRFRHVATPRRNGGKECLSTQHERSCNTHACPADCSVSEWEPFSECTRSCGTGQASRYRTAIQNAMFGGVPCPSLVMVQSCNVEACPIDCEVGGYGDWGSCSKSCGAGAAVRYRNIVRYNAYNGKECPSLSDWRVCNAQPCPQHCKVSTWSTWSGCSKSCGGGTKTRSRSKLTAAEYGGSACPILEKVVQCAMGSCPEHCDVSTWGDWSACSRSCGTGTQVRSRNVTSQAHYGGYTCPSLQSARQCNPENCPIDCLWTDFGPWELCTHSCGTGSQSRTRSVARAEAFGGKSCGQLEETRECATQQCPVDCQLSTWSVWTQCSRSCGSGETTRTRSTDTAAAYGGQPCGSTVQHTSCNDASCPVDCVLGEFESWTICSESCGGGYQTRVRSVDQAAAFAGKGCLSTSETRECETQACPEDCSVEPWGDWTSCSASCMTGTQSSVRTVIHDSAFGGNSCPPLLRNQSCSDGPCPLHCEVSSWGDWTSCTYSCGSGMQMRLRSIITHALHGGYTCPYLHESRTCQASPCPLDCTVDGWGDWGDCSHTCGTGIQSRTRPVVQQPAFGGMKCSALSDTKACNTNNCPVDCIVSDFINWTPCTETCGGGVQERHRSVYRESMFGGEACPRLHEQQSCNTHTCPINCEVSGWAEWSTCSHSCGTGQQIHRRTITQIASHGGTVCPTLDTTRNCNAVSCPIDCVVSNWTAWDTCSRSCGGGIERRTRSIESTHVFGGKSCPKLSEMRFCNAQPCASDCVHSAFGNWMHCSASCGGGIQMRYRGVEQAASFNGQACGALHEERSCNTEECPKDCVVGPFSGWSKCTKLCGDGLQTRTRAMLTPATGGGRSCPQKNEHRRCNTIPCAVHCHVSPWAAWEICGKSCGTGHQSRARSITQDHAFGGNDCPTLTDVRECNNNPCPVDCAFTDFGQWSACSVSCGSGFSNRSRIVTVDSAYGGKACPVLTETQSCFHHPCAQNCIVESWSVWSDCTASCLKGTQARARSVLTYPSHGGHECPTLSESRECDSGACPVNCEVTKWSTWTSCELSCGSSMQQRERSVISRAQHGGYTCPTLSQTRHCHIPPCPVDCLASEFSSWTACTRTCGSPNGDGSQMRSRSVTRAPAYGGRACGPLQENQMCGTHACPSDCVVTEYGSWGPCSKSCGSGIQNRFRSIARDVYNGGRSCPLLTEAKVCNSEACPVDCTTSAWQFGKCSVTCGGGSQVKTRTVTTQPVHGGRGCPALTASLSCENGPCAKQCDVSKFGPWSSCSRSCGPGVQHRNRTIQSHGTSGYTCPDLSEHRTCNDLPCPSDCLVATWQHWSVCSTSCGSGISTRSRSVIRHLVTGGSHCPPLHDTMQCNTQSCPVNCAIGEYGQWTSCTKVCGSGTQQKRRNIVRESRFGGRQCPKLTKTRLCNVFPCGVDCVVSAYSSWSQCDKDCNGGIKRRSRNIQSHAAFGGKACPGLVQNMACNEQCCIGYFSPIGNFCQACSPGMYQGSSEGGVMVRKCEMCAPGQYQSDEGQGSCKPCSDGTFHHEWGRAICLNCEVGKYGSGDKHSITYCKSCPSGKYADSLSSHSCKTCQSCPAGEYRQGCDGGSQLGVCQPCAPGTFKSDVLSWDTPCASWSACDAGHYKIGHNVISDGNCKACPTGRYNEAESTNSSCTVCATCPFGYLRTDCGHDSPGRCVACYQGKYHNKDTSTCEACPTGKFNTLRGQTECKGCMEGRFGRSANSCVGCAAGKYGDIFGSTDSECSGMCAAGRFGTRGATSAFCSGECSAGTFSQAGSTQCTKCGPGKYSLAGAGLCSDCSAGRYGSHALTCENPPCEASNSTAVILTSSYCSGSCPAGRYSTGGNTACTACAAGLFGLGGSINSECSGKCPAGQYSTEASHECTACPAGQFQPSTGGNSCTSCPVGQHQPHGGQEACVFCEAGLFQDTTGTESCKHCSPGKYQTAIGTAECVACVAGKYSTALGAPSASRCWFCPSGKFSTVESATECKDCSTSFTGLRNKHCVQCPAGTYQHRDGSDECEECPSGKFKKTTASGSSCSSCPTDASLPSMRYYWTLNQAGESQCRPHPQDCVPGEWSSWGGCTRSCGGGQQKRTRSVIYAAWGGGLDCVLEDTRNCPAENQQPCPVDCQVEAWSAWGSCSQRCGGGMQSRRRGSVVAAAHGGKTCPVLYEGRTCNSQHCSCSHVHCKLIPGTHHIRVFHHRREIFGNSHVCRYNGAENKCECICGDNVTPSSVDWDSRKPNQELQMATSNAGSGVWHLPLWTSQTDEPTHGYSK